MPRGRCARRLRPQRESASSYPHRGHRGSNPIRRRAAAHDHGCGKRRRDPVRRWPIRAAPPKAPRSARWSVQSPAAHRDNARQARADAVGRLRPSQRTPGRYSDRGYRRAMIALPARARLCCVRWDRGRNVMSKAMDFQPPHCADQCCSARHRCRHGTAGTLRTTATGARPSVATTAGAAQCRRIARQERREGRTRSRRDRREGVESRRGPARGAFRNSRQFQAARHWQGASGRSRIANGGMIPRRSRDLRSERRDNGIEFRRGSRRRASHYPHRGAVIRPTPARPPDDQLPQHPLLLRQRCLVIGPSAPASW